MKNFEQVAVEVFRQYGMNFETAERAGGWTNAVWFNGNFVLRVSKKEGNDNIRREVERAKLLPQLVGYPENIAVGILNGLEWSFSKRVPGVALSKVWDRLSWEQKAAAVKQVLAIMNSVHSVSVSEAEPLTLTRAWYSTFDKGETFTGMERYEVQKIFTAEQCRTLRDILERFYAQLSSAAPVLNHGDITMDNLIWHDGNVVTLLDFEHSVIAPKQLDLHSLVNLALVPYDKEQAKDIILMNEEDSAARQYVDEMLPLFKPYLHEQSSKDLFLGYNILFRHRFLEFWLESPKGDICDCDVYHKMLSLTSNDGGYLALLLQ